MKLDEGMRIGDLVDQVANVVSVDEYASKVSNNTLVLGFYCAGRQVANDLSRFLQKSSADVLDAEVSSAPDMKGRYMVFVELPNDASLGENTVRMFQELQPLTGLAEWVFRTKGNTAKVKISDMPVFYAKLQAKEINDKLMTSESVVVHGGELVVNGNSSLVVKDWGPVTEVCQRATMGFSAFQSYEQAVVVLEAQRLFGDSVDVVATPDAMIVVNESTGFSILVG